MTAGDAAVITERDIRAAIDECQAVDNPTADTCRKLASYYIIQDHISDHREESTDGYSESAGNYIEIDSGTEFAETIRGRDVNEIIPVIDELMTTLQTLQPRLYAGVMRRLEI